MSVRNPLDGLPAEAKARLLTRAPPKWDGERRLAFRRGRDLNLFSRNRIRLNARYPEVVEAIYQQQTTSFIADGEFVTFPGSLWNSTDQ
jgi:ATP-dependent DNA ligase